MTERKMITKNVGTFDSPEYNTLGEMLKKVQLYVKEYGKDARIEELTYPYSDGDTYFAIMKEIPETDEEMYRRIADETRQKLVREVHEKAEFERLKAKYNHE